MRYKLKTLYREGITYVILEPLDFIARLAAPVPRPRVSLTRFHGVLAPNSKYRALVTPAKRGKGTKRQENGKTDGCTHAKRNTALTGVCSCKTGIHAIHGNNLGTTPQASIDDLGQKIEGRSGHKAEVTRPNLKISFLVSGRSIFLD